VVSQNDAHYERKKKLAKHRRFSSRCAMCRTAFSRSGGFTFHHIFYENQDKRKKDFTKHPTQYQNDMDYKNHILDEVKRNPKKFRLLCSKHHHMVTFGIRLNELNWKRYKLIVNESRRYQNR
jgi:hypothetical protein